MKAWRVVRKGRPTEALSFDEVDRPEPGPGQIRARVATTVCNLNEVDGCYGRYKTVDPPLPYTLGMEAVGVVDAVGEGAEAWMGRRVMLTGAGATGAHAEWVVGDVAMAFESREDLVVARAELLYTERRLGIAENALEMGLDTPLRQAATLVVEIIDDESDMVEPWRVVIAVELAVTGGFEERQIEVVAANVSGRSTRGDGAPPANLEVQELAIEVNRSIEILDGDVGMFEVCRVVGHGRSSEELIK